MHRLTRYIREGRRRRNEIDEEIEIHLRMTIQERIDRGETPDDARAAALREFGNVGLVKETTRSVWTWTAVEQFLQDVRTGCRILWKAPALSATAVVLISLVIGGNTTVYSVLHALLTKPAPGVRAERLVNIGFNGVFSEQPTSYTTYLTFVSKVETLQNLFATGADRLTLGLKNGSYGVFGAYVTPNYFESLAVQGIQGHTLADSGGDQESRIAAVISHRLWQDHFQESDQTIGSSLLVNGHEATIVGIAPPAFQGESLGFPEEIWMSWVPYVRAVAEANGPAAAAGKTVAVFGQLKPGISMSQTQAELQGILNGLKSVGPAIDKKATIKITPYAATIFGIADAGNGPLAVFSIVTAITLLVVCANVSNLMLGRAIFRRRETAVRQSLGASRIRILRMLIVEGIAIAIPAWIASCIVAFWTARVIPLFLPSGPNINGMRLNHGNMDFSPDLKVLGYAMVLALIGAISFTVVPAWQTLRRNVLSDLKAGEQSIAQGRSRIASVLVVVQFALTVLLLTSAGLAYRSSAALNVADLGFDRHNLLLLTINPTLNIRGRDAQLQRIEEALSRFRQIPSIASASFSRMVGHPAGGEKVGTLDAKQQPVAVLVNYVGTDYFKTLGIPLAAGREFQSDDLSRKQRGVIIDQGLAQKLWPGQSAVGQSLLLSGYGQGNKAGEIVQVMGVSPLQIGPDSASYGISDSPKFQLLFSEDQDPAPRTAQLGLNASGEITYMIRYSGSLDTVVSSLTAVLRQVDPRIAIVYTRTVDEQLANVTAPYRTGLALLTMFAAISITIAIIGQYAVIAFMMRRRTGEFGIRIALGASRQQIARDILKEGLSMTLSGIVLGFALTAAAGTVLKSLLYGITPTDLRTYLGVFSLLSAASLLACYIPARRAARVDPAIALRYE